MKKLHLILLFTFLICFSQKSISQYDKYEERNETTETEEEDINELKFKERIYYGGNLGLSFGLWTQIDISPSIGYRITNDFSGGIGVKYNYLSFNGSPSFKSTIYGSSVFIRYNVFDNLYAYSELEMLNINLNQFVTNSTERKWVPIGLIGAGYNFRPLQLMILYDLIGSKYNPYVSNFGPQSRLYLKMGILIGL